MTQENILFQLLIKIVLYINSYKNYPMAEIKPTKVLLSFIVYISFSKNQRVEISL